MEPAAFRLTVAKMLGLVAGVAVHIWLFRLGVLWGIVGLSITKHLLVAYLCQILGVDRRIPDSPVLHPTVANEVPSP